MSDKDSDVIQENGLCYINIIQIILYVPRSLMIPDAALLPLNMNGILLWATVPFKSV